MTPAVVLLAILATSILAANVGVAPHRRAGLRLTGTTNPTPQTPIVPAEPYRGRHRHREGIPARALIAAGDAARCEACADRAMDAYYGLYGSAA